MPQDTSISTVSAFGIPLDLEVWDSECTAGQTQAVPGKVEPTAVQGMKPRMGLGAAGTIGTKDIEIQTLVGGYVGTAGGCWKEHGDVNYRGMRTPLGMTGLKAVSWDTGITAATRYAPNAVKTKNDYVLAVHQKLQLTVRTCTVTRYTPSTGAFADVTVYAYTDTTQDVHPCLAVADDGRIFCVSWSNDNVTGIANLRVDVSRDEGLTWSRHAVDPLDATFTTDSGAALYYTLLRLRAVFLRGNLCVAGQVKENGTGTDDIVYQWASSSDGARLQVVTFETLITSPDLCVAQGRLWMAYRDASNAGKVVSTGGAFMPFVFANTQSVLTSDITDDIAIVKFTEREVWIYGVDNTNLIGISSRLDPVFGTITNTSLASGTPYWYWDGQGTPTEYPRAFSAVEYRGQIWMWSLFTSSSGTFDDKLTVLRLGGWGTVTFQPNTKIRSPSRLQPYGVHFWSPTVLPSVIGDTAAGAGTASITTNPGELTITTTANQYYYDITGMHSADQDEEIWAWFGVRHISGGSVGAANISIEVRQAGVAYGWQFRIYISGTQIRLFDVVGATALATASVDMATGGEILIATANGVVSVWYRALGSDEDGELLELTTGDGLVDDGGAGGSTNRIRYGHIATGTAQSRWYWRACTSGTEAGTATLSPGPTNPDDLWPGDYTVEPRHFASGCLVGASGGPAARDDAYTVPVSARYPYRYLLPVAARGSAWKDRGGAATTPRAIWRSTATSGRVAFRWPEASTRKFPRGLLLLQVEASNTASITLQTTDDTTSVVWDTLKSATMSVSFPYTRRGASIIPNVAGSFSEEFVVDFGEYVNADIDLGSSKLRKVVYNTSGRVSNDGTAPIPEFRLETDPTQTGAVDGTEPTSGTAVLRHRRATIAVYLDGTKEYSGFAVQWGSAQATASGFIELGISAFCMGVVLGDAYDRGRIDGVLNGDVLTELDNGVRLVNSKKGMRRVVSLPYTALYHEYTRRDSTETPIYLKLSTTAGSPVVAEVGDADNFMRDLMGRMGPKDLIVYVPALTYSTTSGGDSQVLTGYRAGIYGRVVTQDYSPKNELGTDVQPARRLITWSVEEEI